MYLFAVSRNITEWQFEDLKTSVEKPIRDYIKVHKQLTVAIMFPGERSNWLSDPNDITDYLDKRLFKDETFKADHPIDKVYPFTSDMFGSAIVKYKDHPASLSPKKPMIVLITDFIAEVSLGLHG
ncbi:hypothetical protein AAVH_01395 [Aphelenchoides avenae]|nr:hypothetical protein AAVH_01395 [Aphelenchus avenae]